jgi:hypothetical protein
MAAGINYTDQVILGDYPCDIKSIVRYRGGFNFHESATTTYNGVTLAPFTPMWVNLTTREVFPLLISWTDVPETVDANSNEIVKAFLYNQVKIEEGATVTLVLIAHEVRFSGLQELRYTTSDGTQYQIGPFANLTTSSANRTSVRANMGSYLYVW